MPRPHRAVLFDFFGTLTEAVRADWRRPLAEALGCPFERLSALLADSFRDRACGRHGDEVATMRWLAHRLGRDADAALIRRAVAVRRQVARKSMRLRADAVDVLSTLRQCGYRIGVVSDCTHELPASWSRLATAPLVDATAFSIEVGVCKPDARIYLAVTSALGVEPTECLYVGDGGSRELTGAAALGMTAVRLAADDTPQHDAYQPDESWTGPVSFGLAQVLEYAGARRH